MTVLNRISEAQSAALYDHGFVRRPDDTRGFPSLNDAIEWVAPRWQERPVPIRLHDRGIDGVLGLVYSSSFLRALSAGCNDKETVELTERCYHPLLAIGVNLRECEDCDGTGWKHAIRERFRYPMWRAFQRLLSARNDMPRHPHPAERVMALADANWDGPLAARRLERHWYIAEPLFLTALRQLKGRYEEAPF